MKHRLYFSPQTTCLVRYWVTHITVSVIYGSLGMGLFGCQDTLIIREDPQNILPITLLHSSQLQVLAEEISQKESVIKGLEEEEDTHLEKIQALNQQLNEEETPAQNPAALMTERDKVFALYTTVNDKRQEENNLLTSLTQQQKDLSSGKFSLDSLVVLPAKRSTPIDNVNTFYHLPINLKDSMQSYVLKAGTHNFNLTIQYKMVKEIGHRDVLDVKTIFEKVVSHSFDSLRVACPTPCYTNEMVLYLHF